MPYVTTRTGAELGGIYRTQALADAAAAADGDLTAVQGSVADTDIPADADTAGGWFVTEVTDEGVTRTIVTSAQPAEYTPRGTAAIALDYGLSSFHDFVLAHAAGVDAAVIDKVHTFLYQKRRANRMAFNNEVTIGGTAITLTDPQYIAWATFCRFGPLDTSAVTALGEYNPEGLFDIFERADDPAVLTPSGPLTWVGLDVTQWTADGQGNANAVPNRLNVAQIAPVLGTFPSKYLNVDDDVWLRS